MAIDFPGSPTNGDSYDYSGTTYIFDGVKWIAQLNTGAQGIQGLTGSQGIQGLTGSQGTIGSQGIQGIQGAGENGAQGTQGIQGTQGTIGSQGIQGIQGPINQTYVDSVPPSAVNGDLWFDTNDGSLNVYYFDGDTFQWVSTSGTPASVGTLDTITDQGAVTTNSITVGGLHVNSTSALEMPTGTIAQRPTPVAGMLRFNTDSNSFEGYDGSEWGAIGGSSASLVNIIDSDTGSRITGELTVDSDVIVGGTITELSSIRFKENVSSLNNSLSLVNQLEGVQYNKKNNVEVEHGLIAENVYRVIPEATSTFNGKPYGVHYTRLIPHLIESIKQLTKRIEELENNG